MKRFRAYCPSCKKYVPKEEVHHVVTEIRGNQEWPNRAFHFPNCKNGTVELEILIN